MILLIFGICIIMAIIGSIHYEKFHTDASWNVATFGLILSVCFFVAIIVLGFVVKSLSVIDDRIAMYEEENANIEQQIADVVEQYQKYETDIFMEVAPESAMTMVSLYPELKSDSLAQAQIEVYTENNKTIKDLRDQQIKGNVYRWWLYFGGGNT